MGLRDEPAGAERLVVGVGAAHDHHAVDAVQRQAREAATGDVVAPAAPPGCPGWSWVKLTTTGVRRRSGDQRGPRRPRRARRGAGGGRAQVGDAGRVLGLLAQRAGPEGVGDLAQHGLGGVGDDVAHAGASRAASSPVAARASTTAAASASTARAPASAASTAPRCSSATWSGSRRAASRGQATGDADARRRTRPRRRRCRPRRSRARSRYQPGSADLAGRHVVHQQGGGGDRGQPARRPRRRPRRATPGVARGRRRRGRGRSARPRR